MRYLRPLRDKVLNPDGPARYTTWHFLMLNDDPNREYVATLREATQKKIRIRPRDAAARRSGTDPPPGPLLAQCGARAREANPVSNLQDSVSKKEA